MGHQSCTAWERKLWMRSHRMRYSPQCPRPSGACEGAVSVSLYAGQASRGLLTVTCTAEQTKGEISSIQEAEQTKIGSAADAGCHLECHLYSTDLERI